MARLKLCRVVSRHELPDGEVGLVCVEARKQPRVRLGWYADGHDTSRRFFHLETGWSVQHCGHPTALNPWAVYDAEGNWVGRLNRATRKGRPMGMTFTYVGDAQRWVEEHAGGA